MSYIFSQPCGIFPAPNIYSFLRHHTENEMIVLFFGMYGKQLALRISSFCKVEKRRQFDFNKLLKILRCWFKNKIYM